jgi:acetyltransferase-like isoleucine patch superfamily enzyme
LRYRTLPRVGSSARQLGIRATHLHADVSFGPHCRVGPGFHLEIPDAGTFRAGQAIDFRRNFTCEISGHGKVEIGDLTVFTYGVVIQCSTQITIGRGCTFAEGVLLVDGSHRFRDPSKPMQQQGFDYRPITIGDGASVMAKCTVLADVGERAFVGAGSVVTEPIPAYSLAVGAPARVIEHFGP